MDCPVCGGETKIMETRKDCESVHRYRLCLECAYRFYTAEYEVKDRTEFSRAICEKRKKRKVEKK
jgi:transcriptional regulator NrdR family protein